jgi:hypothetical protein
VTKEQALKELADAELVPCVAGGISDIKEVLEAVLAADIPALLDRPESCGHGHSCAPRIELCARAEDVPRIMQLLHTRWQALLDQEGTLEPCEESGDCQTDPPCPACGKAAPLENGACTECGLQLE